MLVSKGDQNSSYVFLTLAICIGLLFHGTAFFNTLESTYDYYVHIFFADHYQKSWFEPWEYRWYTGFSLFSYPPLVHQLIALLANFGGLKIGAWILANAIIILYVVGIFRFSKLISLNEKAAGYSALVGVFLPSTVETLHLFGQLPMMLGIGWLLNALPEIYLWVRYRKLRYYFAGITIIAAAVCSHHVTPIFGTIFFVLPIMATAMIDKAQALKSGTKSIPWQKYWASFKSCFTPVVIFGLSTIMVTILVILPYWLFSKNDPIVQVPIPHGSRDNFFQVGSSGLVFFIIPWGYVLFLIPFIFYRLFSRRNIFIGLSFALLFLLGTGGTTPIPKMLLGENAFSILTLERFTFWATIWATPILGEFLWRFFEGDIREKMVSKFSGFAINLITGFMISIIFASAVFGMNLSSFRPTQPDKVKMLPIINFLNMDKHYEWRYLTLGFGDQMAWLSTNTKAFTIDGNYHSARRVPELTSRAVERLENSKYRGFEGLGSLQEFLAIPEKYHLKYIFSNDKFYDPMLFFSGWHRVKALNNGIIIWEKSDIPPLPTVLPHGEFPKYQKLWWGILPLTILLTAFFCNVQLHWINHISQKNAQRDSYSNPERSRGTLNRGFFKVLSGWVVLMLMICIGGSYYLFKLHQKQNTPTKVVLSYYDALDFKEFTTSHSYFDPESGLTLDQYMLENSVSDGIVESYGKLNIIGTKLLNKEGASATVATQLEWITPLNAYRKQTIHEVIKRGKKWYIVPSKTTPRKPPEQLIAKPYLSYFNQQRRRLTVEETFHEDVLDRPVIHIKEATLIKSDGLYSIIGQVQNVDNNPADITLHATLLNKDSLNLAQFNARFVIMHKLMPKEVTAFRIDFTEERWKDLVENRTPVFDPIPEKNMSFSDEPGLFKIAAVASIAKQDMYRDLTINGLNVKENTVQGTVFNAGTKHVTIAQVILSVLNQEGQLIWVAPIYLEQSISAQKKGHFSTSIPTVEQIERIAPNALTLTVNGLANDGLALKYTEELDPDPNSNYVLGDGRQLRVELNPFVDNPSSF